MFSICLLVIQIKTRTVYIFLIANSVAILGNLYLFQYFDSRYGFTSPMGESILLLSSLIKSLSFADRGFMRKSNRLPGILIIIAAMLIIVGVILGETVLRLFLTSSAGIFLSLSAIFYLLSNKHWVGLNPLKYCVAILVTYCAVFVFTLPNSYPIGNQVRFIPVDDAIPYQIIITALLSFFFHMAFIGLIVGRNARENTFKLRKSVRMQQAVEQSTAKEKASAALADERYHLLKMLTHEVRQPLNTAQAALEKMGEDLRRRQSEPECIQQTLIKTQSTVNSIVLSISNSILGATLITKGRPPQLHSIDLCDVSQLALSDLDPSQRSRIEKKFEQPVIFADGDPIILRLAIRNLLENAVKYSPSGSPILFEIVTDEEKLTLVIRVTNELHDQSTLSADIFQMNKRGVDSRYEGTGLGLYIVKAVAELHEGDISYHFVSGNQVAFELSIPA